MTRLDALRVATLHELTRTIQAGGYCPELEVAHGLLQLKQTPGELARRLSYVLPAPSVTRIQADALMAEAIGARWFESGKMPAGKNAQGDET